LLCEGYRLDKFWGGHGASRLLEIKVEKVGGGHRQYFSRFAEKRTQKMVATGPRKRRSGPGVNWEKKQVSWGKGRGWEPVEEKQRESYRPKTPHKKRPPLKRT